MPMSLTDELSRGHFAPKPHESDYSLELNPRDVPSLGLQTYEYFVSNASGRERAVDAFLREETDEIPYVYTRLADPDIVLQGSSLESMGYEIGRVLSSVDSILDPMTAEMTFLSAGFRARELDFIRAAQQLNSILSDPNASIEDIIFAADRYRSLNEMLYGAPDTHTYRKCLGEIWANIQSKNFGPNAQRIYQELTDGFIARGSFVLPLEYSHERMPVIDKETDGWVKKQIHEQFGSYRDLLQHHWDQVIIPRSELTGEDPVFDPSMDLLPLFEKALKMLDPDGSSGIKVVPAQDSSTISWDTPTQTVRVGIVERAVQIKSVDEAFGRLFHELIGHCGRSISGLRTNAPILGFGVFSDFDDGENPDYLSFEEGYLTVLESIITNKTTKPDGQWSVGNLRHYVNISMIQLEGRSVADAFELTWRYSLLMGLKDGSDLDNVTVEKARRTEARSINRYRRSIPAGMPREAGPMSFNKDLAYTRGRIIAIPFLQYIASRNDTASFQNSLKVKIDPTNRRQRDFAASNGYPIEYSLEK